jgi:hypothetical protein
MDKKTNDLKTFNMRMPKDIWMFLKHSSVAQEESMTDIIVRCLEKYRKNIENKLTKKDANV